MLAIRCQFLQGTYQASPPKRFSESEWPPHPGRLHAALIAAGWAWGGSAFPAEAAAALQWLEQHPPPEIVVPTPEPASRTAPTVFVPRNLTKLEASALHGHLRAGRLSALQRDSGRVARTLPARVVGDAPVVFMWPNAEPEGSVAHALERLAGEIQYLGSSRSPVAGAAFRGDLSPDIGPPGAVVLEPSSASGNDLRVAYPGLTKTLLGNRWGETQPPLGKTVSYSPKVVRAQAPSAPHESPFDALLITQRKEGFPLTLSHSATLTEALRVACLAQAGDSAPAALHGHGEHPHVAYLALPNVGGRHSDGTVLGLALAIPRNTTTGVKAEIRSAFEKVDLLNIEGGQVKWRMAAPNAATAPFALRADRWIKPSHRWSTVTPVIPDRYPKPRKGFSLEDAVRQSFANALLPDPETIVTSANPMLTGAVPANSHPRPERLNGPLVHVAVTFSEPVVGPLIVGRGRYRGLGLFAPLSDPAEAPDG